MDFLGTLIRCFLTLWSKDFLYKVCLECKLEVFSLVRLSFNSAISFSRHSTSLFLSVNWYASSDLIFSRQRFLFSRSSSLSERIRPTFKFLYYCILPNITFESLKSLPHKRHSDICYPQQRSPPWSPPHSECRGCPSCSSGTRRTRTAPSSHLFVIRHQLRLKSNRSGPQWLSRFTLASTWVASWCDGFSEQPRHQHTLLQINRPCREIKKSYFWTLFNLFYMIFVNIVHSLQVFLEAGSGGD